MKFGRKFAAEVAPEWKAHYVQYNQLKNEIKKLEARQSIGGEDDSVDPSGFENLVEKQVRNVVLFFQSQLRELKLKLGESQRTLHLLRQVPEETPKVVLGKETVLLEFHSLGDWIVKLYNYLRINSEGVRKITKKFNKRVRSSKSRMLNRLDERPRLKKDLTLLNGFPGLLRPLIPSVSSALTSICSELQHGAFTDEILAADINFERSDDGIPAAAAAQGYSLNRWMRYEQYLHRNQAILHDCLALSAKLDDSTSYLNFLSSTSMISGSVGEPLRKQSAITASQRRLEHERRIKSDTYGKIGISQFTEPSFKVDEKFERGASFSHYLNLASTMLYLANYNVCLPTSAEYAEHLGMNASTSGVIVAMTPLAALLSAVGYSYWSNYSFRQPLLLSTIFLIAGNALYALAWDMELKAFVLAGRFITGLGGCRAVNRRYIADTVSVEHRTRASGLFVAAGAVGMSCGPFLASIFSGLDVVVFGWTVNEVTAPAFFMSVMWVAFAACISLLFQDPPGLGNFSPGDDDYAVTETLDDDMESVPSLLMSDVDDDDDGAATTSTGDSTDEVEIDDSIDIVLDPKRPSINSYGTVDDAADAPKYRYSSTSEGAPLVIQTKASLAIARLRRRRFAFTSLCLWLILWVKLVQEALLTAMPLQKESYGWGTRFLGFYMASLGLAVVPANLCMLVLIRRFSLKDIFVSFCLLCFIFLFAGALMPVSSPPDVAPVLAFLSCNTVIFVSAQVSEGVIMSMFSKVISKRLAASTFNSGLLATEAGTLGRALGNAVITVIGDGTPAELSFNLASFVSAISLVSLLLVFGLTGKKIVLLVSSYK